MLWTVLVLIVIVYYLLDWILRSLKISNFTDKYVFITGCDSGFGRELAIRLDDLGVQVFAGCLTEDGATSLSESCSSRLVTVLVDIRKTESIEAALQAVKRKLTANKELWGLVNNAGILGQFTVSELCSRDDFFAALNVNILGMIDMTNYFLPLIRKSKGRIVNTSSVGGRLAFVPAPYTISKYGVEGYSDVLRREVTAQGIQVSVVEPGCFKTQILNMGAMLDGVKEVYEGSSAEVQNTYSDAIATARKSMQGFADMCNPNLSPVVDSYIHALTSRYPRTRYVAGSDAKWFYIPLSYLPDRLADVILARML